MPSRGFAAPSILFLNSWDAPERAYAADLLRRLREQGYTRYVEPCVGAFALPVIARTVGWQAADMTTSDVSLYSAICGYLYAGRDLATLDARQDGERIALPDDSLAAAARLLWTQLVLRFATRAQIAYWDELGADLAARQDEHEAAIRRALTEQRAVLGGLSYAAQGIWEQLDAAADDPHAVIVTNPPSYRAGYEKFFDTDGRLTWAQPEYEVWDPKTDFARLVERMDGAAALLLFQQQEAPRHAAHPEPTYARHLSAGQYVYWQTNRPAEVRALMGRQAVPRRMEPMEPYDAPPWRLEDEVRADSTCAIVAVEPSVAAYYKHLWLHRIKAAQAGWNFLAIVDGKVAGVAGYDVTPAFKTVGFASARALLIYAVGAPSTHYRLTRLATMLALQRPIFTTTVGWLWGAVAEYLSTTEWTPYPESKGLRGLMKLVDRQENPKAGYRLVYEAPFGMRTAPEVLREWLDRENRYRTTKSATRSTTT